MIHNVIANQSELLRTKDSQFEKRAQALQSDIGQLQNPIRGQVPDSKRTDQQNEVQTVKSFKIILL